MTNVTCRPTSPLIATDGFLKIPCNKKDFSFTTTLIYTDAYVKSRVHAVPRFRRIQPPLCFVRLSAVTNQSTVRPKHIARPRICDRYVRPRLDPRPRPQMQRGAMQHVAIPHRQHMPSVHRETTDADEYQVERCAVHVVINETLREATRNEPGVIGVQYGTEEYLFHSVVEVGFQAVDFGADRVRLGRARVERFSGDTGYFRPSGEFKERRDR